MVRVPVATLKKIEWPMLASYLSVCQTNSPGQSAQLAGGSRSAMSTRLSKLEDILALPLFEREHKKCCVNEQGLYLAKYIWPLFVLEHFAMHYQRSSREPVQWLNVRLPLRFYGGRISYALEKAIQSCQQRYPNMLIWPQTYDSFDLQRSQDFHWQPAWCCAGHVQIDWAQHLDALSPDNASLSGQWCVLSHASLGLGDRVPPSELHGTKLLLPRMPQVLAQQIAASCESLALTFEYINADYRQALSLPQTQEKIILINRLLLDNHVLAAGWRVSALEQLPAAHIEIHHEGSHPVVAAFIEVFQAAFDDHATTLVWQAQTQLKHWHYLHETIRIGSISAAAQSLFISQSALSIQLKQFEQTVGHELLQRRMGVRQLIKTEAGDVFHALCQGMESIVDGLFTYVAGQRLSYRKHLSLGVLPSIDAKSTLVQLIANKVDEWQQQHPELCLEIIEERHRYLVDALRNQDLHLAIIEAGSPFVTQLPIQKPEAMGLVVCAEKIDHRITVLDWSELSAFRLVLPRQGNGMRLLIDQHCLSLGIKLVPAMESDSLNINQHWLRQGRYATILPRSAVAQLLEQGNVVFVELAPTLNRVLRLAYLSHRVLNPVEASLVAFLYKKMPET